MNYPSVEDGVLLKAYGEGYCFDVANDKDIIVAKRAANGTDTHELLTSEDFSEQERIEAEDTHGNTAWLVMQGLGICKHCGAAESDLESTTCIDVRKRWNYERALQLKRCVNT